MSQDDLGGEWGVVLGRCLRAAALWMGGASLFVAGATAGPAGSAEAAATGCNYAAHAGAGGAAFRALTPQARHAAVALCRAGILTGTAPDLFSPDVTVTRAQAVKFVVRALGASAPAAAAQTYTDVSPRSPYFADVEAARALGIVPFAVAGGRFWPSRPITRQEFAALAVDALGDQAEAAAAQDTPTRYRDDATISAAYRGDVNVALRLGIVPPLSPDRYDPSGALRRVGFALGLERLFGQLAAARPAAVSVRAGTSLLEVGATDLITAAVTDGAGQAMSAAALAADGDHLAWSVAPKGAQVTAGGDDSATLVASAPGAYVVTADLIGAQGTLLASGRSASLSVYGAPAAVRLAVPAALVANTVATARVTAQVVDALGDVVPSYDGPVTLTDTGTGSAVVDGAGQTATGPVTVTASAGVATFTVISTSSQGGETALLTAQAGTARGSADLTTAAQQPTAIAVTAPAVLSVNTSADAVAVHAQILDQSGVPMLSGAYGVTFSVSGPGRLTSTAQVTYTGAGSLAYPGAAATVAGTAGRTGTITVTASSPGLSRGTAKIAAMLTGAALFSQGTEVTSTSRLAVGAGQIATLVLEPLGPAGEPATATVAATYALTDGGQGGQFSLTPAFASAVTEVTVPAGSNGVTLYYRNQHAGRYLLLAAPPTGSPAGGGGGNGGGGSGGGGSGGGGSPPPAGAVSVAEPPPPPGAQNPPVAMEAAFDQSGVTVAYAAVPASDFDAATDTVSFAPPASLAAGAYQVYVAFAFANQTVLIGGPVPFTQP
jgi:hypothetical protein